MIKTTRNIVVASGTHTSKKSISAFAGLLLGLAITTLPGSANAADQAPDQSQGQGQSTGSAVHQKRLDADKANYDRRDRDYAIQDQANKEERELKKIRAEREAQRAAARQQNQQQNQQQQQQQQQK